ncbi:DUF1707 domain-containing protein [Micromonospora sp. C28SCA-DRY-2]|uniref:DUF1707 SHOCT-like domain-containing protein n=1 Tax=Micromonospora sp. C28SCA-DRY-2 TaxID=3059522 RepID=UPI002674F425|nr:DUF1707 domain-containing protein [Micromonospora sp. C28SCA-DRY-2]MDO3702581.1 DUF1707 domain-containing protein [Micromonospora sp. C28SCA-DRY-2]
MEGRDGMRAADADRTAVADRLRVALDEGRLSLYEYDERLQQAYAARTYAELDALVSDLPAVTPPAASALAEPADAVPAPAHPAAARRAAARWLAEVWLPYLQVVPIVVAIWAISSLYARDLLYFWPGWVAGPWGALLLVRTVTGLAGGEPRRWEAERERRRRRKLAKRARRRALEAGGPDE